MCQRLSVAPSGEPDETFLKAPLRSVPLLELFHCFPDSSFSCLNLKLVTRLLFHIACKMEGPAGSIYNSRCVPIHQEFSKLVSLLYQIVLTAVIWKQQSQWDPKIPASLHSSGQKQCLLVRQNESNQWLGWQRGRKQRTYCGCSDVPDAQTHFHLDSWRWEPLSALARSLCQYHYTNRSLRNTMEMFGCASVTEAQHAHTDTHGAYPESSTL